MAALGAANPLAGYTIKGVQTVYGLSIRREILFPAGTDVQVQVVGLLVRALPGVHRRRAVVLLMALAGRPAGVVGVGVDEDVVVAVGGDAIGKAA